MIRIYADPQTCIGAGQCVRHAPQVFDQREHDGIVVLLARSAPDALAPALQKAVQLCPSQSIRIEPNLESH